MKKIFVETADTPIKRELGLMKRKSLPQHGGMLFKFPKLSYLNFWMKDTYVPLDIAFIDDNGFITQISEGIPMSTKPIYSSQKCKWVLEMNKGWFKNNGIKIGNVVKENKINHVKSAQTNINPEPENQNNQPKPDVLINKSHKEILEDAQNKNKKIIIIYQKKDGYTLPPKTISPPFVFEPDSDGKHDAIVKAWDEQEAQWKSFIVDNIIDMQIEE